MVELDPDGTAVVPDVDGLIETTVLDAEFVEAPEALPGEPAQLGVVAFGLKLADYDERDDHVVFVEP
ncbi:hypothetical protein GCM10009830_34920 [Glycomyces endophyticus]|uniref:Uncharacterized protein n=1 Tax=Glycomyces endophyticus TaxID=480996 RepID=A0ABN2HB75_9ACTN